MESGMDVRVINTGDVLQTDALSANELSQKLQKSLLRLKGEFMAEDGKGVDYAKLKTGTSYTDYKKQAQLLQLVTLDQLTEDEKKSFFLNIYNALTIHGLADLETLPKSVLDVKQFWRRTGYKIGQNVFSLDDIEHGILRGNRSHPASTDPQFSSKDPRLKFALKKLDPRIHFALVCGAKSCPAINVYTPANIDQALDVATRNFALEEVSMFTEVDEIWLSRIFQWYQDDFGGTDVEVIKWIVPFLRENIQDRAHVLLFKLENVGQVDIKYNEYNWSLNKV
ncbi:hypothetical protein ScPMuIL_016318 [Solemya velum]